MRPARLGDPGDHHVIGTYQLVPAFQRRTDLTGMLSGTVVKGSTPSRHGQRHDLLLSHDLGFVGFEHSESGLVERKCHISITRSSSNKILDKYSYSGLASVIRPGRGPGHDGDHGWGG
jgi:hypothetical protein